MYGKSKVYYVRAEAVLAKYIMVAAQSEAEAMEKAEEMLNDVTRRSIGRDARWFIDDIRAKEAEIAETPA